jgi:nicotinate-nucleotide adenylyltransferase
MDSVNEILEWKKPLELFTYCDFIVATRPKSKIRTLKRLLKFPPLKSRSNQISIIEVKMDISSTEIRERIKTGKTVKRFVPATVLEYIERHGLYK